MRMFIIRKWKGGRQLCVKFLTGLKTEGLRNEEGFGKEKIIAKLVRRFGINEAAAEAYYEKYA